MRDDRPVPTGNYEVVQDFECPSASVRVLRLSGARESIEPHVHRRSMQIYVSLEGRAVVAVDGEERILEPYDAVAIWPGSAHGASPDGEAILLNISVPPLARDDQLPVQAPTEFPDLRLPTREEDVND
ncbi:MAG TPA: cupin domain-containing protein [Tepidiformaceae bacterium]|nr:cupin domain-containing protein [Tepidiformaceae bacterium]